MNPENFDAFIAIPLLSQPGKRSGKLQLQTVQFAGIRTDYQALLRKRGILMSMSGRGNCYDNSMVETLFRTIKSELIWPVAWQSRQQAENAVARYIDGFHNPVRLHSSLGFQSPVAFARKAREVS
jgi:putative transposase